MNDDIDATSFAGTWRLRDAYAESDQGREAFPLGENTRGQIIYDVKGFMSAQLMSDKRALLSARDLDAVPLAEFKTAYITYTSYYGSYTLDTAQQTITHQVEGALAAAWVGRGQLRYYEFVDDNLVLRTPPIRTAAGHKVRNTLVWQRACG